MPGQQLWICQPIATGTATKRVSLVRGHDVIWMQLNHMYTGSIAGSRTRPILTAVSQPFFVPVPFPPCSFVTLRALFHSIRYSASAIPQHPTLNSLNQAVPSSSRAMVLRNASWSGSYSDKPSGPSVTTRGPRRSRCQVVAGGRWRARGRFLYCMC